MPRLTAPGTDREAHAATGIVDAGERESLLTVPVIEADQIRYYTLSRSDLAFIRQHRWDYNRLGVAISFATSGIPAVSSRAARCGRRRYLRWWQAS